MSGDVSDEGRVVVVNSGIFRSYLCVVSDEGREALRIRLATLPEESEGPVYRHRHIISSTAGNLRRHGSLECLLRFDGREYFSLTFLWGDEVLLDLTKGAWVREPDRSLLEALRAGQLSECLRQFEEAEGEAFDALAAIIRNPSSQALEGLTELETRETFGNEWLDSRSDHQSYKFRPANYGWPLRFGLRRCGVLPAGQPSYQFKVDGKVEIRSLTTGRDELWATASAPENWRQALSSLGVPDNIMARPATGADGRGAWADVWDYFVGLRADMRIQRLNWAPGVGGEKLERMEVIPVDEESIGDLLVSYLFERPTWFTPD